MPQNSDTNIVLQKDAFWQSGKAYEDSTKSVETSVYTDINNGLMLGDILITPDSGSQFIQTVNFWVSCPIDLTQYDIGLFESILDSSTLPNGKQINIYIAQGNTESEAQGATLVLVQDKNNAQTLGISGSKWFIFALELV